MELMGTFSKVVDQSAQRWTDPEAAKQVVQWLNSQGKELRVLVDKANSMGHHTTTMNMVRRIIKLGYTGTIRIFFYPKKRQSYSLVWDRSLELLIPGFQFSTTGPPPNMQIWGVTLAFTWMDYENERPLTPPAGRAPLLICGGSEGASSRRLDDFDVDYYLQLQPYAWRKGYHALYYRKQNEVGYVFLDEQPTLGADSFISHAYYQPFPTYDPDTWAAYQGVQRLQEAMARANLLRQHKDSVWFAPAYGLSTRGEVALGLFTYAAALVSLQDLLVTQNVPGPYKPFVLVTFHDLTDEWQELTALLGGTREDMPDNLVRYLQTNPITQRVVLFQGNSSTLQTALNSLQPNQVMILPMPNTPSDVFNWFYYQAIAPGVFEGRGTLNTALNMGVPYLCTDSQTAYPNTSGFGVTESAIGNTVTEGGVYPLVSRLSRYEDLDPVQFPFNRLARTMLQMVYPPNKSNPILAYFWALRTLFHDERTDKLAMALRFFGQFTDILKGHLATQSVSALERGGEER